MKIINFEILWDRRENVREWLTMDRREYIQLCDIAIFPLI